MKITNIDNREILDFKSSVLVKIILIERLHLSNQSEYYCMIG